MPTGYTASIADGTVTSFSTYAMECARAFGALVLMRDDPAGAPIPEEFKASSHHDDSLAVAKARLADLQAMNASQCELASIADYNAECERRAERLRRRTEQRDRYTAMLRQVEHYVAPTADHVNFRQFMIDQLKQSIEFDCLDIDREPLVQQTAGDWLAAQVKSQEWYIDYHTREAAAEKKRATDRTQWVKALRDSLKGAS